MPVWTVPSTVASGQVITAAQLNSIRTALIELQSAASGTFHVDRVDLAATSSGYTTVSDITGLTITHTAVSSIRYRTIVYCPNLSQVSSAGLVELNISDGAGTPKQRAFFDAASGQDFDVICIYDETGISGSTTRKARLGTSAGSVSVIGDTNIRSFIHIQGIGL